MSIDQQHETVPASTNPVSTRGFAGMDVEKRREIARRGGKAAHAQGRAHRFTTEEARAAGKKGGDSVSRNRDHMAAIGRLGGIKNRRRAEP
jgi:general stress protein YciG